MYTHMHTHAHEKSGTCSLGALCRHVGSAAAILNGSSGADPRAAIESYKASCDHAGMPARSVMSYAC